MRLVQRFTHEHTQQAHVFIKNLQVLIEHTPTTGQGLGRCWANRCDYALTPDLRGLTIQWERQAKVNGGSSQSEKILGRSRAKAQRPEVASCVQCDELAGTAAALATQRGLT